MAEAYTLTVWRVKPDQEEEFVRRWTDFADLARRQGLTAPARLLRDVEDPSRFVSFGPWKGLKEIAQWRSGPEFHQRVSRLQEVLDGFEPQALELVIER